MLSDLLVDAGVEQARFRAQVRLEGLHAIVLVKLLDGIVWNRILQIAKHARLRRANFDTRGFQPTGNPMVAQRALLGRFGNRTEKTAAVRAGLDAKAAPDA